MHVSEIDTPALVVDLDILERNLARAASYASEHGLRLRPHTKTHKSIRMARRQLELGAAGLTVAKVSEAEVMVDAGSLDLLVAYPIIGRAKLERLMKVARHTGVTVALDSLFAALQLSVAARAARVQAGVLAEVDVGLGRVGVSPGEPLIELAKGVRSLANLSLEGIAFYPGQVRSWDEAGRAAFAGAAELLRTVLSDFRRAGIEPRIVSGGSTPTLFHSHEMAGLTEIRPGTYVFNDVNTVHSGGCSWGDCAATVLATVVSTARPGQMIVDGGSKTFSSDRLADPADATFGCVTDAPGARFHKMNEEHGFIDITQVRREFAIGDRVRIIPNHICVAVNLHDQVYGLRGDTVEETWKVDARGKLA
jgi:D-serine deaminase-like pyridoxal phosphate-dependent protein